MRPEPSVAAILEQVREAGIPEWHTLPPIEGRTIYRQRAAMFEITPPAVGAVWDTTIPAVAEPLSLRVYRPDVGPPRPILVYLHGGGWTLGDLDSHDVVCRRISVAADCMVVSVDYRLAPEHPYPAAMDDTVAAIRWLAEHGAELGGDPTRLAVGGDSAGGNLSAGAVIRLRDEGHPGVAIQVLIYPATQASFEMLSFYENEAGYLLTSADVMWFWRNYLGKDPSTTCAPYACPGAAADLRGLPPAVMVTAGFDPLRDDGEIYAHKLRAAGVPVIARRFPGMIHGFVALPVEVPAGRRAIAMIARALRRAWSPAGLR